MHKMAGFSEELYGKVREAIRDGDCESWEATPLEGEAYCCF